MGFGMSCVKYLMFIFNFVFALAGLAMLVVGALMQSRVATVSDYLDSKFSAPPIFLIVVGSIVFVVSFYGCCGAIRESSCMVTTFSIFLMVILVAGIALAVLAFVYRSDYENAVSSEIETNVANYGHNSTNDATVDSIQSTLECCGAAGPTDYTFRPLPKSCCMASDRVCNDPSDASKVYQSGCVKALQEFTRGLGLLIGCLAIGVAIIMIMGIIFGLCLASSIRNEIRRGYA